jgi:hypothetical protein
MITHQKPEQFIRVLAAFSHLSPERLGWDPTMKVHWDLLDVIPSYEVPWNKLSNRSKYDVQWVIMHNKEQWVSLETISLVHSEMLVGRATLVFRVVKWKDFEEGNENVRLLLIMTENGFSTFIGKHICDEANMATTARSQE